jgi:hypothetical protein
MDIQELLKQLNQLNNVARQDYADMNRVSSSHTDECDDFQDGYAQGYEDAREYFGNMIDDLSAILRSVEIDDTMQRVVPVSEYQKPLL